MTLYEIALFVHILGAIGAFVGLGLEWDGRVRLAKASAEQVSGFERLGGTLRILQSASGAAILTAGLYMTLAVWGFTAWIVTGLAGLFALVALGAMTGRRTSKVLAGVGTGGPNLETGQPSLWDDPLLWASLRLRTALALGVVFVMVTKPALVGALSTMAAAVAAAAFPGRGRRLWHRGGGHEDNQSTAAEPVRTDGLPKGSESFQQRRRE
jgi:hypothetical protein